MSTVFTKSAPGREGVWPKQPEHDLSDLLPAGLTREVPAGLPSLSESMREKSVRLPPCSTSCAPPDSTVSTSFSPSPG